MLTIPILFPRRSRGRGRGGKKRRAIAPAPPPPPPPPPVALALVSATYDVGIPSVRLTFDRAINIGAFNGATVVVDDQADSGNQYQGTGGAILAGPNAMDIFLADPTTPTGTGTTLTVTAGNGIVASGDGGTWAGVLDLPLPYP